MHSAYGLVAGICVGLAVLFGLLFDSFRIGLVLGIAAGSILCVTMLFLDIAREDNEIDHPR